MAHLVKFAKQSPLQGELRICALHHLTPLETLNSTSLCSKEAPFIDCAPQISVKDRILASKSQCLDTNIVPSNKGKSFTKWAFHSSWKNPILKPNYRKWVPRNLLKDGGFPLKSGGVRGFCAEAVGLGDPKPAPLGPRVASHAQDALMEYLHFTAGLEFSDAEHMSKHSPICLDKMLNKLDKVGGDAEEIGRALSRFLRYHPPNEFELLFESMGLKPSEFNAFLPRDLMYLKDDGTLLDNYHALYNYGVDRGKMGKIFKEASDAFKYEWGVLELKLTAYEKFGLGKSSVIKLISSSPDLLLGDVNREFVQVLEELGDIGIKPDWIRVVLSEKNSYNWGRISMTLKFCSQMGLSKKELGTLIRKHPDFVLDGSGKTVLLLTGFLLKVGSAKNEITRLITQFPQLQVGRFMKNLRNGLQFLLDVEMDPEDVKRIFCAQIEFFGQHTLKKANSVVSLLQTNNRRLHKIIKEDPHQLKNYVKGTRLCPLPNTRYGDEEKCRMEKREFLLRLGFVENSKEMQKALRDFRGKGDELQERYDFLVKCGLESKDVYNMIKRAPNVLNQKVDVLQKKIDFLTSDLGFPVTSLAEFPKYLAYTEQRVKFRFLMYNWLKDEGKVGTLAFSTVLASSDGRFRKSFVSTHPLGQKMWEKFKAEI